MSRYSYTGGDLKGLRAEKGLTKRELAMELGLHENSVRNYEAAADEPLPKAVRMSVSAWLAGLPPISRERLS